MNYPNPHAPHCPWHDLAVATGAPNIKWCEETLCQWISEPANTWSNTGYLLVAVYIMYLGWKHRHNARMKLFGPIVFFMGAMSFFYHQSNFYGSQILDFVGMFFFVGWAIGMNLIRLGKLKPEGLIWFILSLASVCTAMVHAMYVTNIKFQVIVLVAGLIIVITEFMARHVARVSYKWFATTIGLLLLASAFSISDHQGIWCDPTRHGWFSQGHAIWHWIAAIAMLTLYFHYSQAAMGPWKAAAQKRETECPN